MKTEKESKLRLAKLREAYESALLAREEYASEMEKHLKQYMGSPEIDGSAESAGTVRNVTYEIIESEISSDIPHPKVEPASYSESREHNARSVERLCSSVRSRLPFEEMNDRDERYTYIFGGSVWYVEWDGSVSEDSVLGGIKIHCISPLDFIPQPGIHEIQNMDYCFLRFTATKGEIAAKYGISEEKLELCECEYEWGGDSASDTVSVVVAFYRDEDGEVGKLVFSGELVLCDLPRYYTRRIKLCKRCGKPYSSCLCGGETEEVELEFERIVDKSGAAALVPYYTPREFPIILRKNTPGVPSLFGSSDCGRIRPEQQAINKIETRILQKLLRAGVTPVMPEGASVTLSNAVFGQVIKTRPGESLDSYGKIDTTPDVSQDIAEADRLYDHARRIVGITDALTGGGSSKSESGFAMQLKISQSSSRLESKRRMKYLAYSEIYRMIFTHYLAFADEARVLDYKDAFGTVHSAEFRRSDFITEDGDGGYRYDDGYLFSVDLNSGTLYSSEELWEKNLRNLTEGTLGDKDNPATLLRYWQSQERAGYPYARENVEYFKDIIEKEAGKQQLYGKETTI
ncbi:MAG: hypothetical protein J6K44_06480 [Clostridia bacterium]|nr:hypothetical protein [Clostridia bacterium]